jgi:flagellar basal-body rod protein FlgC
MSSLFRSMDISSSGLAAQRVRMNVLSSNLANAQTTQSAENGGGPYRRQDVVFSAVPTGNPFEEYLDEDFGTQVQEVKVTGIHKDTKEPRRVFDPTHPHADKDGMVEMPNIQVMNEMVNMIAATRAYEANVTALNNAKAMATKALEIGR